MKNSQIFVQVFKKYVLSFALIAVLAVCAFVFNPFNNKVYASERIAWLKVEANLVDGNHTQNFIDEKLVLYDLSETKYDVGNVDVEITSTSKLVYNYEIHNLLKKSISFDIDLEKQNMINMCFVVKVNGEDFDFENKRFNLEKSEKANIEISIFVDKVARDACLDGNIVFNVSTVSEV